jgi:class 3 adenylate cyclase
VAERRLVCVLFADLVGFTPFAEERDAEAVRETLTSYFAIATRVIELYGGRVEKFIGDAVMALWGAPVAREDDAERAVRAALDLVNTAARVQSAAEPGTVLVGEATMRAANAAIAFAAAGERDLKGKAAPIAVRRARNWRSTPSCSWGLTTRRRARRWPWPDPSTS